MLPDSLPEGAAQRTAKALPDGLLHQCAKLKERESVFFQTILPALLEIPLLGHDGLEGKVSAFLSIAMTLFKPNLQLRKLRVMRGTIAAYSADFHEGVNIIRGQNASGKSTVVDFIFYVLGGENYWEERSAPLQRCSGK